jgi:hypothetical protein
MNNLLSGLEMLGFDQKMDAGHLFDEEKKTVPAEKKAVAPEKEAVHTEDEFLLDKTVHCPVCDHVFQTRVVKSGRAKRLDPDFDLRPRFAYIDTNKYDVASCPKCGYTAMNRYFAHVSSAQIKLLREGVKSRFKPSAVATFKPETIVSYDTAILRYKLALLNTVVKRGKNSEKAYVCLKLSWLYRGWNEEQAQKGEADEQTRQEHEKEGQLYYEQAYEGFCKAIGTEPFPMCGMEKDTMDLLLANMAFRLQKTDQASRFVASLLSSNTATRSIRERAKNLKEEIIQEIRDKKAV